MAPLGPLLHPAHSVPEYGPMFLVGAFCTNLHAVHCMRVGRKGGEPPNLRRKPDEYGGTARAPKGLARELFKLAGTGWRVPGMVRSPHAEEHPQPRVHSRVSHTPHFVELTAFCGQHPRAVFATRGLDRILCSRIRNQFTTSGFRFNDSTGDGPLPLEWAQDRVSQDPRGSLCNNLPSLVGKAWGQCRDCYGATDEGLKERTKPVRSILSF